MRNSKEREVRDYPAWKEYVLKSYGDSFSQVTIRIDKLLSAKLSYYLPGSFYSRLLETTAQYLEPRGKQINVSTVIEKSILKSLTMVGGIYNMSTESIAADPELVSAIAELQTVMTNTAIMVQMQDTFDELKDHPFLSNN